MSELSHPSVQTRGASLPVTFTIAVVVAAAVSAAISAVVATIAHDAGVSQRFAPLNVSSFVPLIVIGLLAGAAGWAVVRRRSNDPARLLRRLAPTVIVLSFAPDLLVGIAKSMTATTWAGVAALMVMHVVVAVCGVSAFRIWLPLNDTR